LFGKISRSARYVTVSSVLIALLSGCSGGSAGADSGSVLGEVPDTPIQNVRATVLGMQKNRAFPEQATDLITEKCMRKAGQSYTSPPATAFESASKIPHDYGINEETASQQGYWDPDVAENYVPIKLPTFPSDAAKKEYYLAYFGPDDSPTVEVVDVINGGTTGVGTGGCLGEGRKAVYGEDLTDWLTADNFAGNFDIVVLHNALDDPTLVDLNEEWSACMKKAGFPDYNMPDDALAKSTADLTPDLGQAAYRSTIDIAVADATCEEQLDYADQRETIEDRYFSAGVVTFEGQIQSTQEFFDSAAKNAQTAIREYS